MPLDANIILQGQAPKFDSPLDAMTKAMTLKSLAIQNQQQDKQLSDQNALNDALKRNITTDPNGNPTVNKQAALSDLYKTNPLKAIDYQKMFQGQDIDTLKQHTEAAKNLSWSVLPDGSNYQDVKQKAVQMGLPNADKMPDVYSPTFVQNWQVHTLNGEDQLKKMEIDAKLADTRENRAARLSKETQDMDTKAAAELDKHLSQGWAGRSGQAGAVQGKVNAAEAAEQLIEQGKSQKDGLDSRQIEELAQSTARLLGGTTAASARVDALVPHTLLGRAQTLKEWLTNNPQGADQEAFVNRIADTVQREKSLAQNQMRQFQIEGLPSHVGLKNRNPNLYNSILQAKGISPDMIDKNGRYAPPAKASDLAPKTFKTNEIEWAE